MERALKCVCFAAEEDLKDLEGFPSALRVDCKLNHQTRRTMSHSARVGAEAQRKGRNAPSNVSPPIPPNTSSSTLPASTPFVTSGAHAPLNLVLARQRAQEKK